MCANIDSIAAETMNRVARAAEKIEKLEPRLEAARQRVHGLSPGSYAEP